MKRAARRIRKEGRRSWSTPSLVIAAVALFVVLGGSAVAATKLIRASDIGSGAVVSRAIKNGSVQPWDLSGRTRSLFTRGHGVAGARGDAGTPGAAGSNGANGPNGADGAEGSNGANGANGADGANGPNGANGIDGANGVDGANGIDGTNGSDGTNGTNGTIAPLSASQGLTALPTGVSPTTVVELTVPAGSYVVLAKTNLSHTGAGDSVECVLKADAVTLDQIAMKTLPALAAIPAALQAVATPLVAPTLLSVQCTVAVANGTANFSSLIAIPTA